MIKWFIHTAIILVLVVIAVIFLRFRFEDDSLVIRLREEQDREELLDKVEEVGQGAKDLADKLQSGDLEDAAVEAAGQKAKTTTEKAARDTIREVDNMDTEALENILEEAE